MVVFNMLLTCKITGSQTPDLEVFVHFLQLHYSRVKKNLKDVLSRKVHYGLFLHCQISLAKQNRK